MDLYPPVGVLAQPPAFATLLQKTVAQTVTGPGNTPITWPSVVYDTGGQADTANNRIVVKQAGKTFVYCTLMWASHASGGRRIVSLLKNGVEFARTELLASSIGFETVPAIGVTDCAVGDLLTVSVYSDQASTNAGSGNIFEAQFGAAPFSGNANGLPAGAQVRRVAAGGHNSSGNFLDLTYDTVDQNTDGMWTAATPSRFTSKRSAFYVIAATVTFVSSGSGSQRIAVLRKNRASVGSGGTVLCEASGLVSGLTYGRCVATTVAWLDPGDTVDLEYFQDSGGTLALATSPGDGNIFSIVQITGTTTSTRVPPGAWLLREGTQTLPATTWTDVIFNKAYFDTDLQLDSAGRFVCRAPGRYSIVGNLYSPYAGSVTVALVQNGGRHVAEVNYPVASAKSMQVVATLDLAYGDVITLAAYAAGATTMGGAGIDTFPYACQLQVTQIAPISLAAIMQPEAWHVVGAAGEPAYQNSWVAYGNYGPPPGFYKDPMGIVRLRGLVRAGTLSPTMANPAFTLPVGYRPDLAGQPGALIFVVASNGAYGEVRVDPAGGVHMYAGSNGWFELDSISFRAA